MQIADVVLYDNLVSQAIVDQTNPQAERIYVGKKSNRHTLPQEEINAKLVALAQSGKKVLRLNVMEENKITKTVEVPLVGPR